MEHTHSYWVQVNNDNVVLAGVQWMGDLWIGTDVDSTGHIMKILI